MRQHLVPQTTAPTRVATSAACRPNPRARCGSLAARGRANDVELLGCPEMTRAGLTEEPWFREAAPLRLVGVSGGGEAGDMTHLMTALPLLYHGEICAAGRDTATAREAWGTVVPLSPDEEPERLDRAPLQDLVKRETPGK